MALSFHCFSSFYQPIHPTQNIMKTILLIEDTLTEALIIKNALTAAGYNIIQAGSSEEAKSALAANKPDLILTDIVLPGESGFELCRSIKETPEMADIPVVMCSTKNNEMDKFWGMKQGAAAYITKPISEEELLRTVKLHA
jgi:chemotaxis family two-component system response regulator PixH